jgi:hypothetical protein
VLSSCSISSRFGDLWVKKMKDVTAMRAATPAKKKYQRHATPSKSGSILT